MSQDRASFGFTHLAAAGNALDTLLFAYLNAVGREQLDALKSRFLLAVGSFWLPYAAQALDAPAGAIQRAADRAVFQCQQQRLFLRARCGLDPDREGLDNHLLLPGFDDRRPDRSPPQAPVKLQLSLNEMRETETGRVLAYLSQLTRADKLLKVLQPLRVFWSPLACRHYGWSDDKLAGAAHAALAILDLQEARLQQFLPPSSLSPAPADSEVRAPAPTDSDPDDIVAAEAGASNGRPIPRESFIHDW